MKLLRPFTDEQIRYIVIRLYIQGVKPGQLHEELMDPDAFGKYGVKPLVKIFSRGYFYKVVRRAIPTTTVEIIKLEWLNGLLDVPLANKRMRLEELSKLYYKDTNAETRRKILRDIKDEVGEEAWREAMEKSGKSDVQINLHDEFREFFTAREEK